MLKTFEDESKTNFIVAQIRENSQIKSCLLSTNTVVDISIVVEAKPLNW